MTNIRCNKPVLTDIEIQSAVDSMRAGNLAMGPVVETFEDTLASMMDRKYAIAFHSATSAFDALFEMIISPGDEVIISPFTFHSVIYSILRNGGVPVFIDIKSDFLADWSYLDNLVTDKTIAIVATHIFGKPDVDVVELFKYREEGIYIIEDCAQSLGAKYFNKYVGNSLSDAAIFSFYATKNITAAEGGVLVTNYEHLNKSLRNLRNNGIVDRLDGKIVFGTNRRMSDIHASIGLESLMRVDDITLMRNYESIIYDELLEVDGLILDYGSIHARHHYTILVDEKQRYSIYGECLKRGITLGTYYTYLANEDKLVNKYCKNIQTPKCSLLSRQLLQLPLGELIHYYDQEKVVSSIKELYDGPIYAA